jgi:hypothetical protein
MEPATLAAGPPAGSLVGSPAGWLDGLLDGLLDDALCAPASTDIDSNTRPPIPAAEVHLEILLMPVAPLKSTGGILQSAGRYFLTRRAQMSQPHPPGPGLRTNGL